jgi:hypothetical protein
VALDAPGIGGNEDPGGILRFFPGNAQGFKNTGAEFFQTGTNYINHRTILIKDFR